MALKLIRIGSAIDVFQYDDGSFDSAIETDAPIKAGTPIDGNDVVRLEDLIPHLTDLISTNSFFFARIY